MKRIKRIVDKSECDDCLFYTFAHCHYEGC